MKIDFIFRHEFQELWEDGLYGALWLLKEEGLEIDFVNLFTNPAPKIDKDSVVLAWGAFGGPVDLFCKDLPNKKALCIAGVTRQPAHAKNYDILFYETDWFGKTLKHPNRIKAFGINTDIYRPISVPKIWDWISVGAFALWKRQDLILNKDGDRIVIGEVQTENFRESLGIIANLTKGGVAVHPMVRPETLSLMYNASFNCYIPADINGGGERAVLEARSCGIPVEVESDNPKLKELLYGPVYSHKDYAKSLKEGLSIL